MKLDGPRLTLSEVVHADEPRLRGILASPEVSRWWGEVDDFEGMLAITLDDGVVIGAIQYDEEEDPQYRHAGIDIFLAPEHHGRGYGREAVRTLARWLIEERGHHRLTIDPAAHNEAAIRAYEKVGFRRVGVRRSPREDLMDLLAEELT
ncbi:GNAT family protein [Nonomuraea sp. NPDC049152]|uniref:GNAT family N-acetyltransferase n=1 Tax=Nonomuraea sp. NPDC049152 TaxID=3154350 RepID=UPI0033CFF3E8